MVQEVLTAQVVRAALVAAALAMAVAAQVFLARDITEGEGSMGILDLFGIITAEEVVALVGEALQVPLLTMGAVDEAPALQVHR